ncbi:hypothetical protein Hdeb2414_s0010g00332101 [Helianthus debilis subsp. tardiflorus]
MIYSRRSVHQRFHGSSHDRSKRKSVHCFAKFGFCPNSTLWLLHGLITSHLFHLKDFYETGYLVKAVRMELGAASSNANEEPKLLWNLWAIPKANYLAWRAFSGSIPSKSFRPGFELRDFVALVKSLQHIYLLIARLPEAFGGTYLLGWGFLFLPIAIIWSTWWMHSLLALEQKNWIKIVHTIVLATIWRISSKEVEDF